jgi:hypothetical protein
VFVLEGRKTRLRERNAEEAAKVATAKAAKEKQKRENREAIIKGLTDHTNDETTIIFKLYPHCW